MSLRRSPTSNARSRLRGDCKSGEVRLGVGPYVAESLMPACIRKFSGEHPGVRLRIQMDAPDVLGRALTRGTIDLAVAEGSVLEQDPGLEIVDPARAAIPGCFVARTKHPLRSKATVTHSGPVRVSVRTGHELSASDPETDARAARQVRGELPPFPSIECPSFMLAKCAILDSDAVTVASLVLIEEELRAGPARADPRATVDAIELDDPRQAPWPIAWPRCARPDRGTAPCAPGFRA